jgi:hypothetical protein
MYQNYTDSIVASHLKLGIIKRQNTNRYSNCRVESDGAGKQARKRLRRMGQERFSMPG